MCEWLGKTKLCQNLKEPLDSNCFVEHPLALKLHQKSSLSGLSPTQPHQFSVTDMQVKNPLTPLLQSNPRCFRNIPICAVLIFS
jgi:hypothetical protein